MKTTFNKARPLIYRNARPVDLARWQFHFENGSQSAVLNALSAYQNEDGGFGHALEADAWNPLSTPIQTWTATEILREINFADRSHPIIQGIVHYLESGRDFNGHFWYNTVKSNNDWPHAPWWHTESDSTSHENYNPTACLAGFLVRFADKSSPAYSLGCRIAREAYDAYMTQEFLEDMHTVSCYIRLMEYLEEAEERELADWKALQTKLIQQVKHSITQDTSKWATSYICKPSQFLNSKNSVFFSGNEKIAEYECAHIRETQQEDGSWNIPWGWNDFPEAWVLSKNWWKAHLAINNMLYLKGLGEDF